MFKLKNAFILSLLTIVVLVGSLFIGVSESRADGVEAIEWTPAYLSDFTIESVAKTEKGYQFSVSAYNGGKTAITIDDSFFTKANYTTDITVGTMDYTLTDLRNKYNTVVFAGNSLTGVKNMHVYEDAPVAAFKAACYGVYADTETPTLICENRAVSFGAIGEGINVYAYTWSLESLKKGQSNVNANTDTTSAYNSSNNSTSYIFHALPEITPADITLTYTGENFCNNATIYNYCEGLTKNLNNKVDPVAVFTTNVLSNSYNWKLACTNSSTGVARDVGKYNMVATANFMLDTVNKINLSQSFVLTVSPIKVYVTPYVTPVQSTDGKIDVNAGTIYGATEDSATVSYKAEKVYDGTTSADANLKHFTYVFGDAKGRLLDTVLAQVKDNLSSYFIIDAKYADENIGSKNISFTVKSKTDNFDVQPVDAITGKITPATIGIKDLHVEAKTYDGNTTATLAGIVSGIAEKDTFDIKGIPVYFADANVGENKPCHVDKSAFTELMKKKYPNYQLAISDDNLVGNILAKTLIATVDPVQMYQGQEIPDLDVVVSGFVTGESAESLAGFVYPTANTTANKLSGTGNYPIYVSGGSPTQNYVFEYVTGTLNIASLGSVGTYSIYSNYVQSPTSTAVSISGVLYNGAFVSADAYGWTVGKKDINFFKNGRANTGNTFTVLSSTQWYTLYAKVGANTIYKYEQFPVLSDPTNVSADATPPVITVSKDATALTKGPVKLNVSVTDNLGVDYVTVNGTVYKKSTFTIEVKSNTTVTIVAKDLNGNEATSVVKVTNIDKTAPTIKAKVTSGKNVKITVKDNKAKKSKIKVRWVKGNKSTSAWSSAKSSSKFKVKSGKVYTVIAKDSVGNKRAYHFKVTRACKVTIVKK